DDDISVHEIWKNKFNGYDGEVKYFTTGIEGLNYLNSIGEKEKEKAFLITEYNFGKESLNGVEVIEKTKLQDKHIIVTSKYLSDIKEFEEKRAFLKISHKMYLNDIPLFVH
ncbi:MAG: hypothetical protein LBP57_03700, partial [Endomicrobium sp.]|nr:hypothetical protein [Endomicrobium sp.]